MFFSWKILKYLYRTEVCPVNSDNLVGHAPSHPASTVHRCHAPMPCTARLACHQNAWVNPTKTYMTHSYMILLLCIQKWFNGQTINTSTKKINFENSKILVLKKLKNSSRLVLKVLQKKPQMLLWNIGFRWPEKGAPFRDSHIKKRNYIRSSFGNTWGSRSSGRNTWAQSYQQKKSKKIPKLDPIFDF